MVGLLVFGFVLGLLFLVSALAEWEWVYSLWDVEATRALFGEAAARWFCGVVGVAMMGVVAAYWAKAA